MYRLACISFILTMSAMASAASAQIAATPQIGDAAAAFSLRAHDASGRSGLMVETPPVLTEGTVKPLGTIASFNVRFGAAARLQKPVWSNNLGFDSGALLFFTVFSAQAEAAEPIPAWCGAGHGGLLRLPYTNCLLETPDGKARLVGGVYSRLGPDYQGPVPRNFIHGAPPWYVSALEPTDHPTPIDRPPLAKADASELPLLTISLIYIGREKNGALRFATRIGADGDLARIPLKSYLVEMKGGAARFPFGKFDLVMVDDGGGARSHWEASSREAALPAPIASKENAPGEGAASTPGRPKPTPFVLRGAKIDPTAMQVQANPVGVGGTLLSGPAYHWRTAHADVDASVLGLHVRTAKDAVFHEIELVDQIFGSRTIKHAWCGQVIGLNIRTTRCLDVLPDGSVGNLLYFSAGAEWMSGLGNEPLNTVRVLKSELNPSEEDLIGPMNFSLKLDKADQRLSLHAEVERNGQVVKIWRDEVDFSGDGTARLPFWSHTIVLRKVKTGFVEIQLRPDGDGRGLLEIQ